MTQIYALHSTACRARNALRRQLSAFVASGERSRLLQANAVHKRISMPMHELPFGLFTAKDLCDTQRPVLLWQPADLGTHPFDRHQNDEITRGVGCYYLLVKRAGLEEPRHRGT